MDETSPTPPLPMTLETPNLESMAGTFDPEMAIRIMSGHGHGGFIGLTYHAHGPDWVEIALPWHADLVGDEASGVLA